MKIISDYQRARANAQRNGRISIGLIQRELAVGFARAAAIAERLEREAARKKAA